MKKILLVFSFFCYARPAVFPQSVFGIDVKKDLAIGTASFALGISPFFLHNEPENIPGILDVSGVNGFDRPLMFAYNGPWDIASDYAPYAVALLPVVSVIPMIKNKSALLTYGVMYAEALLLTYGTAFSLKNAVIRYRPYMYAGGVVPGKEKDYYNSFPSGAASFSFLSASFLSATFSREFPESEWKLPVILGSYALAAGIGAGRVLTGAHFLTDVLAGAAIGSLYGLAIPWLHLKKSDRKYTVLPAPGGLSFSIRF